MQHCCNNLSTHEINLDHGTFEILLPYDYDIAARMKRLACAGLPHCNQQKFQLCGEKGWVGVGEFKRCAWRCFFGELLSSKSPTRGGLKIQGSSAPMFGLKGVFPLLSILTGHTASYGLFLG